jgi:hypothetical protein
VHFAHVSWGRDAAASHAMNNGEGGGGDAFCLFQYSQTDDEARMMNRVCKASVLELF